MMILQAILIAVLLLCFAAMAAIIVWANMYVSQEKHEIVKCSNCGQEIRR